MARQKVIIDIDMPEVEPPTPADWIPDRFEARFGSPIGNNYHTGGGEYSRIKNILERATDGPIARKEIMKFLSKNPGKKFASEEVTNAIGMSASGSLTYLRNRGDINGIRRGGKYLYWSFSPKRPLPFTFSFIDWFVAFFEKSFGEFGGDLEKRSGKYYHTSKEKS